MSNKIIEKILVFIIICLVIITGLLIIIPTEKIEYIETVPFDELVPLDYDYIWNVTENISHVVYDAYDEDDIPKGRAWGTKGEYYTANEILIPNMSDDNICDLDDVNKIEIGPINNNFFERQYSSKVETIEYYLTINLRPGHIYNNDDDRSPFPNIKGPSESDYTFPITECFVAPTGRIHYEKKTMDCIYEFEKVEISEMNINEIYPFGGTLTDYYYNISIHQYGEIISPTIGQPVFISNLEDMPTIQEGKILILEDESWIESIIDYYPDYSSIIIINDDLKSDYIPINKYNAQISIASSYENNLSEIIELLKNDTYMIADNILNNNTLTFTYNFNETKGLPSDDFVKIIKIPEIEEMQIWDAWGEVSNRAFIWYLLNNVPIQKLPKCEAIIISDCNNNTHFMGPTSRNWQWFSNSFLNNPSLPFFSINGSIGGWIIDNKEELTASGYLEQEFKKQTSQSPGVLSYNVVGYKNISNNSDNSTIVLSNRYDGWWGQTPGDSGAGAAIILGIGKYIADNDMPLKHNLLFLFTTGEEYGKKGAWHYVDSHKNQGYNYFLWIGMDQLAFNHSDKDIYLAPQFSNKSHMNITLELEEDYDYYNKTGYRFEPKIITREDGSGSEDDVWLNFSETIDTICFVKVGNWTGYHRAGNNYFEGDSMEYIDQDDLNATSYLALETFKEFIVGENIITKFEEKRNIPLISILLVVIIVLIGLIMYKKKNN